jgi:hypothetical protein
MLYDLYGVYALCSDETIVCDDSPLLRWFALVRSSLL